MDFFTGLIIFFIVVWIFVKTFSSNEKVIEVTTIDKEKMFGVRVKTL